MNCSRKKFVKAALINGRLASGIPGNENILGNGLAAGAATAGVRARAAAPPGAAAAAPSSDAYLATSISRAATLKSAVRSETASHFGVHGSRVTGFCPRHSTFAHSWRP